jgi:hypothetical protein
MEEQHTKAKADDFGGLTAIKQNGPGVIIS